MAAFVGDFDDLPEEEPRRSPLPAEDRLWRHPSELGNANPSFRLDPVAVRRRWLQTEPSRGSAWTAGLVGALLATGLVVLGTHLVSAMTANDPQPASTATTLAAVGRTALLPGGSGLSPGLARSVAAVGAAVATVEVSRGALTTRVLGLVVRSDGMLVVPAAEVNGASAIVVTPTNDVEYVGEVVGSDAPSGVAVIHVNGASGLATASLAKAAPTAGAIALAVTTPGGTTHSLATISSLDNSARLGSATLIDTMTLDVAGVGNAIGGAVIDGRGQVIGLLAAASPQSAIATPAWLVRDVAAQLMANGSVERGWLGVTVGPAPASSGTAPGAEVVAVARHSAGARAGLRPKDVITSVNRQHVTSVGFLLGHLYTLKPGNKILLGVMRNGSLTFMRTRLGDRS